MSGRAIMNETEQVTYQGEAGELSRSCGAVRTRCVEPCSRGQLLDYPVRLWHVREDHVFHAVYEGAIKDLTPVHRAGKGPLSSARQRPRFERRVTSPVVRSRWGVRLATGESRQCVEDSAMKAFH